MGSRMKLPKNLTTCNIPSLGLPINIRCKKKGKFPSQTQQNPRGVHEMDEVKAVITFRSGKKVKQPMPKQLDEAREGQDEEPKRIVVKEDMMKKSMPPPFP